MGGARQIVWGGVGRGEGREAAVGSARERKKLHLRTNSDGISRGGTLSTFWIPLGVLYPCSYTPLRFADFELKGGYKNNDMT